jgi:hypothetical protein
MDPPPTPRSYQPEFVSRRLHDLGSHLGDVRSRVRLAIVDAIRSTVADMARDAVDRVLRHTLRPPVPNQYRQRSDDYDPWADDEDQEEWAEPEDSIEEDPASVAPHNRHLGSPCPITLAFALEAGAWWLRQRGTFQGACGAALLAAMAAGLTKRFAGDHLALLEAAAELVKLQRCLSVFSAVFARI